MTLTLSIHFFAMSVDGDVLRRANKSLLKGSHE